MTYKRKDGETPEQHGRRVIRERREAEKQARLASWEAARQRDYQRGFTEASRNDELVARAVAD